LDPLGHEELFKGNDLFGVKGRIAIGTSEREDSLHA